MSESGQSPSFGDVGSMSGLLENGHGWAIYEVHTIARAGALPSIMHDPRALPQRDPRPWPARYGCPISRFSNLEVVNASNVLDDAIACVVPDVDAEGEMRLGLHGQVRLDSPAWRGTYTAMLRNVRPLPAGFIAPCLPSPAGRPPTGPGWIHEIKLDGLRLRGRQRNFLRTRRRFLATVRARRVIWAQ
jgi:hypothetical protein